MKIPQSVIATFPETFGLRGFRGRTFRISEQSSYVDDRGEIILYTQVKTPEGWLDFAKGSPAEIRREVVR